MTAYFRTGGSLQWDEINVGSFRVETQDSVVPCTASNRLVEYFKDYMKDHGLIFQ